LQDADSAETIDDSRPPADSRAMSNGVLMPEVNSGDNSELTFARRFGDHAMQQLLEREATDVDGEIGHFLGPFPLHLCYLITTFVNLRLSLVSN
jgi:hypothetical protein